MLSVPIVILRCISMLTVFFSLLFQLLSKKEQVQRRMDFLSSIVDSYNDVMSQRGEWPLWRLIMIAKFTPGACKRVRCCVWMGLRYAQVHGPYNLV